MNFEEYLRSKKIDAVAFQQAEPKTFETWRSEFAEMHPNSFTIQKLNLINPVRRKYRLSESAGPEQILPEAKGPSKPGTARPIIKPKPKIN